MGQGNPALTDLPVGSVIEELLGALDSHGSVVLTSPPGTGKTTVVPPALARADHMVAATQRGMGDKAGRVVLVVPRRIAARAAAARMASTHGETVGATFGYSVRGDRRVSRRTRVEAVTPGLLLRRLQSDPELAGVATVVLDEFHERSVDQDLLLSLLLDTRNALRNDLRLVVMSATLDVEPLAKLLRTPKDWTPGAQFAPVISVDSPLYPLETMWRPGNLHEPLAERVAEVVAEALISAVGDVLVFLPGRGEIAAARRVLGKRIGSGIRLFALHGSVPAEEQDAILGGHDGGHRRVILATSIAETSITVPGVRTVVDAGLRRTVRVDPATGLPSLDTGVVSLATAEQRRGRAAREGPGECFRMWAARDEETRRSHDPPEILTADLASLALSVKAWGADSTGELRWLDQPPTASLERAWRLLDELNALGSDGRLNTRGRALSEVGFHPRIGSIAARARKTGATSIGAELLAVLEHSESTGTDLLDTILSKGAPAGSTRDWERVIRGLEPDSDQAPAADRNHDDPAVEVADLVLAGYPDRLARQRDGRPGVYLLRSGGEVEMPRSRNERELERGTAGAEWIVAIDLDSRTGGTGPGRLHLGCPVPPDVIEEYLDHVAPGDISQRSTCGWNPATGAVRTHRSRMLGAIELDTSTRRVADAGDLLDVVTRRVSTDGPAVFAAWPELTVLRSRVAFLRATDTPGGPHDWPDLGEDHLRSTAAEWVPSLLGGRSEFRHFDPTAAELRAVLTSHMPYPVRRAMDELAPPCWVAPNGREFRLTYGAGDGDPSSVVLAARLQHLLGTDVHPTIGAHHTPLVVELLSPAGRPLQRTTDLPGFWRGTYAQVRSEMRGRYRKHAWPERPWEAG